MTINQAEQKAKELLKTGKPVHGYARDLLFDAALREMWEQERKQNVTANINVEAV